MRTSCWLLCVFLAAGLSACAPDRSDPNQFPYRLEEVFTYPETMLPVDLDGDGLDERAHVRLGTRAGSDAPKGKLDLKEHDGTNIDQVNYAASLHQKPLFRDLDGDEVLEILVPFVRDDSLFLSIVSAEGRKRGQFFVTTGEPRQEPEGAIPWDPTVRDAFVADINADGTNELVTVMVTQYARLPRGVWIHTLPDGALLGSSIIGGIIYKNSSHLGNFDADERLEILFATGASNNGAVAGGMDDQHSYLGVFELSLPPRVEWKREMGGLWTNMQLHNGNFGRGSPRFLAVRQTHDAQRNEPGELFLVATHPVRFAQQRTMNEPLTSVAVANLDQDAEDEIVALGTSGTLTVLNAALGVERRRQIEGARLIGSLPDVDRDGRDEVVVQMQNRSSLLLDPDLRVNAVVEEGIPEALFQRGVGNRPYVVAGGPDGGTHVYRLAENPFYLAYRYGPLVGWVAGLLLVLGIGVWLTTLYRRKRVLESTQALALNTDRRGVLVLRPDGQTEWMNSHARALLRVEGGTQANDAATIRDHAPALADLIDELASDATVRQERTVSVDGEAEREVMVTAEPLPVRKGGRPYWLLIVEDASDRVDPLEHRAWRLMAQRVAHDLRSPLHSVLHALHRLRTTYREHDPDLEDRLDPYAERIEERVDHVRRITKNFMKFVDLEEPTLAGTDLTAFVRQHREMMRRLVPPDVRLTLKLADGLPPVQIDHEQMQSVLENLVSNAIEALPEGGAITLSTELARGLWFPDAPEPRDYVALEVRDTGEGMSAEVRQQVFDPGFTTSEEGTGLGLAIVRKIVTDHGGHIDVESTPDEGTVFTLYLPVRSE